MLYNIDFIACLKKKSIYLKKRRDPIKKKKSKDKIQFIVKILNGDSSNKIPPVFHFTLKLRMKLYIYFFYT